MRLPSSWQAPPPTHLHILLAEHLNSHPVGDLLKDIIQHGPKCWPSKLGSKQPLSFSPWKALPGKTTLFQVAAQRSFEHWVQFEACYNSRPDILFFRDSASEKQLLPNQETKRKTRSSGAGFGKTRPCFYSGPQKPTRPSLRKH